MTTRELRPMWGRQVTVLSEDGVLDGTMVSATRRSVWVVIQDQDVFVDLAAVRYVRLVG